MWIDWKKKFRLILILISGQCLALPDIPSLQNCPGNIFHNSFQNDSQPSNGGGGATGSLTRIINFPGGSSLYYLYVPSTYDPDVPIPLLITYHGTAGAGNASQQAQAIRDFWQQTAEDNNFIVLAQTGSSANGSWTVGLDFPLIRDEILDDLFNFYNIETTRIYGHGFSAGGHVMHTMMLFYNNNRFAAYTVSAGALERDAIIEDPNVPANNSVVPVYISHGQFDNIVPISLANQDYAKFIQAGWQDGKTIWLDVFNGGHTIEATFPQKSWDQLCRLTTVDL